MEVGEISPIPDRNEDFDLPIASFFEMRRTHHVAIPLSIRDVLFFKTTAKSPHIEYSRQDILGTSRFTIAYKTWDEVRVQPTGFGLFSGSLEGGIVEDIHGMAESLMYSQVSFDRYQVIFMGSESTDSDFMQLHMGLQNGLQLGSNLIDDPDYAYPLYYVITLRPLIINREAMIDNAQGNAWYYYKYGSIDPNPASLAHYLLAQAFVVHRGSTYWISFLAASQYGQHPDVADLDLIDDLSGFISIDVNLLDDDDEEELQRLAQDASLNQDARGQTDLEYPSVIVAPSKLPNAGLGLFARTAIKAGDTSLKSTVIIPYEGTIYTKAAYDERFGKDNLAPYAITIGNQREGIYVVDAQDPQKSSIARYANDCYGPESMLDESQRNEDVNLDRHGCNALLLWDIDNSDPQEPKPFGYIGARRDIEAGEEILVNYGEKYWKSQLESTGLTPRGMKQVALQVQAETGHAAHRISASIVGRPRQAPPTSSGDLYDLAMVSSEGVADSTPQRVPQKRKRPPSPSDMDRAVLKHAFSGNIAAKVKTAKLRAAQATNIISGSPRRLFTALAGSLLLANDDAVRRFIDLALQSRSLSDVADEMISFDNSRESMMDLAMAYMGEDEDPFGIGSKAYAATAAFKANPDLGKSKHATDERKAMLAERTKVLTRLRSIVLGVILFGEIIIAWAAEASHPIIRGVIDEISKGLTVLSAKLAVKRFNTWRSTKKIAGEPQTTIDTIDTIRKWGKEFEIISHKIMYFLVWIIAKFDTPFAKPPEIVEINARRERGGPAHRQSSPPGGPISVPVSPPHSPPPSPSDVPSFEPTVTNFMTPRRPAAGPFSQSPIPLGPLSPMANPRRQEPDLLSPMANPDDAAEAFVIDALELGSDSDDAQGREPRMFSAAGLASLIPSRSNPDLEKLMAVNYPLPELYDSNLAAIATAPESQRRSSAIKALIQRRFPTGEPAAFGSGPLRAEGGGEGKMVHLQADLILTGYKPGESAEFDFPESKPEILVYFTKSLSDDPTWVDLPLAAASDGHQYGGSVDLGLDSVTSPIVSSANAIVGFHMMCSTRPKGETGEYMAYYRRIPIADGHLRLAEIKVGQTYQVPMVDMAFPPGPADHRGILTVTVRTLSISPLVEIRPDSTVSRTGGLLRGLRNLLAAGKAPSSFATAPLSNDEEHANTQLLIKRFFKFYERHPPLEDYLYNIHVPRYPATSGWIPASLFLVEMPLRYRSECQGLLLGMLRIQLRMDGVSEGDWIERVSRQFNPDNRQILPGFNQAMRLLVKALCLYANLCDYKTDYKKNVVAERFLEIILTGMGDCEDEGKHPVILAFAFFSMAIRGEAGKRLRAESPLIYWAARCLQVYVPFGVEGAVTLPSQSRDHKKSNDIICHVYGLLMPRMLFMARCPSVIPSGKIPSYLAHNQPPLEPGWEDQLEIFTLEGTTFANPFQKPMRTINGQDEPQIFADFVHCERLRHRLEDEYHELKGLSIEVHPAHQRVTGRAEIGSAQDCHHMSSFYREPISLWSAVPMLWGLHKDRKGFTDLTFLTETTSGSRNYGVHFDDLIYQDPCWTLEPTFTYSQDELLHCYDVVKRAVPFAWSRNGRDHLTAFDRTGIHGDLQVLKERYPPPVTPGCPNVCYRASHVSKICPDLISDLDHILSTGYGRVFALDYDYYDRLPDTLQLVVLKLYYQTS